MWEQSMGLWKGGRELERAELTPLCITTGAEQLGSTSCSTGGVEKDFLHLSAFAVPRTSVCCVAAQKGLPWGVTWAGRGWVHAPCKVDSLRPQASPPLIVTVQHLGVMPKACGSALGKGAPGLVFLLSSVLEVGPASWEHNFGCKPIAKLFTKSSGLKLRAFCQGESAMRDIKVMGMEQTSLLTCSIPTLSMLCISLHRQVVPVVPTEPSCSALFSSEPCSGGWETVASHPLSMLFP